jgi:YD repeat-containing protein
MRITGRDEMKVSYTGRGHPKLIEMGERKSQYFFDKAGRLIKVIDSAQGELTYDYNADEQDIRVQMDTRTAPVNALMHSVTHHNQNLDHLYYTRGRGNPWQAVVFNQQQGKCIFS